MENHKDPIREQELATFQRTMDEARRQLALLLQKTGVDHGELIDSRKEMWENTVHYVDDFDRLTEINQYLAPLQTQTSSFLIIKERGRRLKRMLDSPYFARLDFTGEEPTDLEAEPIYIGRSSLEDEESYDILVYDWRSPIASLFYRFERGPVSYEAPAGTIRGSMTLKRQFEIKSGEFHFYFDSDLQIADDFLRQMLSKNTSAGMKSIVETIQRDQDLIIRDEKTDLLMVQGAAGSGKTSVALHRVAYLMYQGLSSCLKSADIVLLSPNRLFGEYISKVLPDLGEENITFLTFEELGHRLIGKALGSIQPRAELYECLMWEQNSPAGALRSISAPFKGSAAFVRLLRRLAWLYERQLIEFTDLYYAGKVIADRQELKTYLLRRAKEVPIAGRLAQLEEYLNDRLALYRRDRLAALEAFTFGGTEQSYDYKQRARLFSVREGNRLRAQIKRFTEIDAPALYRRLFEDRALFYRAAKGLELPPEIEALRVDTARALAGEQLPYEDLLGITYLQLLLSGSPLFLDIRQVVVDEAQDYDPIHFEILAALFPRAKFTVLGDVNQTIGKRMDIGLYDLVSSILARRITARLTLAKSFRSTAEITAFSKRFLPQDAVVEAYGRGGEEPRIIAAPDEETLLSALAADALAEQAGGYGSIGILVKSAALAESLVHALAHRLPGVARVQDGFAGALRGVQVLPIYLAKGLEFDAVHVYGVDAKSYYIPEDQSLLYVAATRALHRLTLYYTGDPSPYLLK